MIVNGIYVQSGRGRLSDSERNSREYLFEKAEFDDESEETLPNEDDAHYVSGVLHMGDLTLDSFHEMANALE